MKKTAALFTLAILFVAATLLQAQDLPHMEFVKALRSKGMTDLALEYLTRLEKTGPKDLIPFLPLERAKVRMDMATNEFNVGKRQDLFDKAYAEFEAFAKGKPTDPLAAEAKFEMGHIRALQGRGQLAKAIRLSDDQGRTGEIQKAHDMLAAASKELKAADRALEEEVAKNLPPKLAQAILTAKLQCTLEKYVTAVDLASTYEPLNKSLETAGELVKDAATELKRLHAIDPKLPVCWNARAWAGKAFFEIDQPKEAEKEFAAVLEEKSPAAQEAHRLARFFQFQDGLTITRKRKADDLLLLGTKWLNDFPDYHKTNEGNLIRLEVGKVLLAKGSDIKKTATGDVDPKAKEMFLRAVDYFTALTEFDNEYSDEAGQRRGEALLKITGLVPVASLTSFDNAFTTSQAYAAKLSQTEKADERKQLLEKIRDVLVRAFELADSKVPEAKYAEARANLAYVYMATGDPYKAVVIGEDLAYRMPTVAKAATGGTYALQAYGMVVNDSTQNAADPKLIEGDNARMMKLFLFIEKNWPNDVNTDAARHQVGSMFLRQKKAKEAADVLSRVSAGYKPASNLTDARWWWSVACQQLANEANVSPEDKKKYQEQALKALNDIPEAPSDAHAEIAQMWIQARMQIGQLYFESKKFDEMEKLAKQLQDKLPKLKNLDPGFRNDMKRMADTLMYYAMYGRAQTELNAGNSSAASKTADQVLQKVTAQVRELKKEQAEAKAAQEKAQGAQADELKERVERLTQAVSRDSALERILMIIALRAAIQENNMARAKQLLFNLQAGSSDSVGQSVYVQIVHEIQKQIAELKLGLPKTKPQLDKTVKSFADFLEELGKSKLDIGMAFFLANAYISLEKYGEAGRLLARVPALVKDAKDKDGKDLDQKKKDDLTRAAQLLSLQNLRKGKQFDEAQKLLIEIKKSEWGSKSTQIDEEAAHLFQDQQKYDRAAVAWKDLMTKIASKVAQPKIKEQYYEAYYNYLNCLYRHAITLTDAKKQQEYIKRVAALIVKLEVNQPNYGAEGLKEKYQLLLKETPLKKEYDAAKSAASSQ